MRRNFMNMRHKLDTVEVIMTLLCLAFCGADMAANAQEDTLRLLLWQAPTTFIPHLTGAFKDLAALRMVYEPLASFDAEGRLIPVLAAEIPSVENGGVAQDGTSVTWKLKPNVTWSDGQPFTADDVLFTYEFIMNPQNRAVTSGNYTLIDTIDVLDDLTLRINFTTITPACTTPFVGQYGMILPRHVWADYDRQSSPGASMQLAAVGTGPYRMVAHHQEDLLIIGDDLVNIVNLIYEANPLFRELGKPYFRRVELQGGGDVMMAARAVLVNGVIDFAWNLQLDSEQFAAMEAAGTGRLMLVPGSFVERIVLNQTDPNRATETGERSSLRFPHPFFSDKTVRQAFAHAIDRQAIAALYGQRARPVTNILTAPPQYNSPNTANLYPFDLARAAALLDAAGWRDANGDGIREQEGRKLRVVFQTSVNPIRQNIQTIVKHALESIGVEVELKGIDASIFFAVDPTNTNTGRHFYADLQTYFAGNSSPDPQDYMGRWLCAEIAQQANNWTGSSESRWCHAEYDELLAHASAELDPDKRQALFIRLNDLLVEDVVLIPLANLMDINGASRTLEGIALTPWDSFTWNIKEWRRQPGGR